MLEVNSGHCRFQLQTDSFGVSAAEISCISCKMESSSYKDMSSELPQNQDGGDLPFLIYQDVDETSSKRMENVAQGRPLAIRSESFTEI